MIIVAGILDTKGREITFLAEQVRAAGGDPRILDLTVGGESAIKADIPLGEVLEAAACTPAEIVKLDRHRAAAVVTQGAKAVVARLVRAGQVDGIVSFGGSMGASIATEVMRSMPIGIPKLALTTMASGNVRPYVGTSDICLMYPIAEAGLNSLTKRILTNAAYGIAGMARAPKIDTSSERPLVGCMMFGVTTPAVLRAASKMDAAGYDIMINHAIGTGGMSMEQLIADGFMVGMLDITTHELVDERLGGVLGAGPDRLTAAARHGVPQVVAPGGLDLINFGPKDTVPITLMAQTNLPGRALYEHNPTVTCVGVLPEEAYEVAKEIGTKLSESSAPCIVAVPMRGWGACDLREADKALGWAGPGAGPVWVSDPDRPEWSLRSKRFLDGLAETLDLDKANITVLVADLHMNDPRFADLMASSLIAVLNGRWNPDFGTDGTTVKRLERSGHTVPA